MSEDKSWSDYFKDGQEADEEKQRLAEIAEKEKFALFRVLQFVANFDGIDDDIVRKAYREFDEFQAKVKGYEIAIAEMRAAYPVDVFPDTTQDERDEVIKSHRGFIDRTGAMMGRHLAKVVKERAAFFAEEILEG